MMEGTMEGRTDDGTTVDLEGPLPGPRLNGASVQAACAQQPARAPSHGEASAPGEVGEVGEMGEDGLQMAAGTLPGLILPGIVQTSMQSGWSRRPAPRSCKSH